MAERKSFLVYRDWEDDFSPLSAEQVGTLFLAIFAYVNRGQRYDGDDPMVTMAFSVARHTIDRDAERYRKRCEQNSKNAKKKGHAQSETDALEADADEPIQTAPAEADASERCQSQAKRADIDKDRDIDIDREKDTDTEKDRDVFSAAAGPAPAEPEAAAGQKEEFGSLADRCRAVTGITPDPAQQKLLEGWRQAHGEAVVERLFDEAKTHSARRFGYLTAVMNRWERMGVPGGQARSRPQRGPEPQRPPTREDAARRQAALEENRRQLEKLLADTAWMEDEWDKDAKNGTDPLPAEVCPGDGPAVTPGKSPLPRRPGPGTAAKCTTAHPDPPAYTAGG